VSRILLLALAAAAPVVAAPLTKDKPVYYYPTRVGDTRVYETTSRRATTESKDEVTKVEVKDGALLVWTGRSVGGRPAVTQLAIVTERAVYRPFGTNTEDRSNPILKLPAKPGESWTHERQPPPGAAPGPEAKATYTIGKEEEIEVPAGKFRAVQVVVEVTFGGKDSGKTTYWHAPGIGLVKAVMPTETTVLKSFKAGK
jgi:hypothetical protein